MNQLIEEINQLLRTDVASIAQTRLLVARLKEGFLSLRNRIDQFNANYTNLRRTHLVTLENHQAELAPITVNIGNARQKIAITQKLIDQTQVQIDNETCCCEECIQSIIRTIEREVEIIDQIRSLIDQAGAQSFDSNEKDQNLCNNYRCINEHLEIILNLYGQPNLPDPIDLGIFRNKLDDEINRFNDNFRNEFSGRFDDARRKLNKQNRQKIDYLKTINENLNQIITKIHQILDGFGDRLSDFRGHLSRFSKLLDNNNARLIDLDNRLNFYFGRPDNFWLIFKYTLAVFCFFSLLAY